MNPREHRAACLFLLVISGCSAPPVTPREGGTDAQVPTDLAYDILYPDAPASDASIPMDGGCGADTCSPDVSTVDTGPVSTFCALGLPSVPGAIVPSGVCVRRFADIGSPRTLAFAPNGDLFVAAPSNGSPGGAAGGPGAIVVMTDANRDGLAEQHTFLSQFSNQGVTEYLNSVQGLVFGRNELFFTTQARVFRVAYTPGQLVATPGSITQIAQYAAIDNERWTHGLAYDPATSTLYTSQSVYGAYMCPDTPRNGRILRVDTGGQLVTVSEGFRNPMYMRCEGTSGACFAAELGDDGNPGAMEKLLRIRSGTNYGYPCCYTQSAPDRGRNSGAYDCSLCAREDRSIPLADTPFGFAWEPGIWPLPFRGTFFLAKHGVVGSWVNAGIYFATIEPTSGAPVGDFMPLVLGFAPDDASPLSRPADVAFAPDGRLFFADDNGNAVYWVAPDRLSIP